MVDKRFGGRTERFFTIGGYGGVIQVLYENCDLYNGMLISR